MGIICSYNDRTTRAMAVEYTKTILQSLKKLEAWSSCSSSSGAPVIVEVIIMRHADHVTFSTGHLGVWADIDARNHRRSRTRL